MTSFSTTSLALLAGGTIAIQSSLSGQLSKSLNNPPQATLALYSVSAFALTGLLLVSGTKFPSPETLHQTPHHLWYLGSFLSILALSTVYWLMPQIGVARVMSGVVSGQLLVAMLCSHFAWFDLPSDPLTAAKILGAILLLAGVVLLNGGPHVTQ